MKLAICDTAFGFELYGLLDRDGLLHAMQSICKHMEHYYAVRPKARISRWQNIDDDNADIFYIETYDAGTDKWRGWANIHFERNLMPNIPYEQYFDLDEFMEFTKLMEENI